MKLQSLGIIFVIIIMPMILIISYYLGLQIDTITLRNRYENALIDATNDAMNAFELNTANENFSNVSDSLRTIIEASNKTFFNTFATSIGVSNANKNTIEPYIPSILYTLYDGYYIYAPTRTPIILEKKSVASGDGLRTSEGFATVGDEGVVSAGGNEFRYTPGAAAIDVDNDYYGELLYEKNNGNYTPNIRDLNLVYKTDYVLKSFMPYSATYYENPATLTGNRATINYTLDNFINISAQIGTIYYTKSGYYIGGDNLVNDCIGIADWDTMGQDELKEFCMGSDPIEITLVGGTNIVSSMDFGGTQQTLGDLETALTLTKQNDPGNNVTIQELETIIANRKAVMYYLTNTAFSNWVNANLSFVTGEHFVAEYEADAANPLFRLDNSTQMYYDFATDGNAPIFSAGADPEDEESLFNNHRYNVIKNAIKFNLNIAISTYDSMMNELSFAVPDLNEEQWRALTEKVSVVAFAQGLDCGLEKFSDYAAISSTNNEITVLPDEIYYVRRDEFNDGENHDDYYYHRLDCEEIAGDSDFISFKSKEVKYDEIEQDNAQYVYDHKNYACYDCIVNNNYYNYDSDVDGIKDIKIKLRAYLGIEGERDPDTGDVYINDNTTLPNILELQKAYLIAVAKERQNLYKTTQYSQNEGIETDNSGSITWNNNISKAFVTIEITNPVGIVSEVTLGGNPTGQVISTGTKSVQTIEIPNSGAGGGAVGITGLTNHTDFEVSGIKYIYK